MKLIGQLYRPQIGLIPVGAATPQHGQDLPPAEAAQAAQWIGCEFAVPIHYYHEKDPLEFAKIANTLCPWMEVKCINPGEELVISVKRQGSRTTFLLKD